MTDFNFDLDRMEEAFDAPSFTVPDGLTREKFRQWIIDCAEGKIEPDEE